MTSAAQRKLPTIYWINLDRSQARRERMQERLATRNLANVRIAGVDGQDPAQLAHALRSRAPTPGEAGCLASHLRAIKEAYTRGDRHALVLEDDATFEPFDAWPDGLSIVRDALPDPFSACSLCICGTPRELDRLYRRNELLWPRDGRRYFSLVATLYHRRALQHLMRLYDRGDAFDVRDFRGRHDAEQVIMQPLHEVPGLPPPVVSRIPLLSFEGDDSEIHPAHLAEHRAARDFAREHQAALVAGNYRSPFTWQARWARLRDRLAGAAARG
jgi:hypothetical protein